MSYEGRHSKIPERPVMEGYLVLRPLNEIMLKIFSIQNKAACWLVVEQSEKKCYPGPELEPGPLASRASALNTTPSRTSADP